MKLLSKIDTIIDPYNVDILISKLRSEVRILTKEQASKLAIAVSRLGHRLPNPATFLSVNTFGQGALLISDSLDRINRS